MSNTAEDSIGTCTSPEAEEREEIWVSEIDLGGEPIQPRKPNTEGNQMGPKVSHVVVHHKEVLETFHYC